MVETKRYLEAVIKCSLDAAESQMGELRDYFLAQAGRQQARLDAIVEPVVKSVKKSKKKKR
jgi:hypothetical protein